MKYALILEKDSESCRRATRILHWLGYVTAPVHTPIAAINAASIIQFDVIVTCAARTSNDRRALTGELKRAAPQAAVILITDNEAEVATSASQFPGVSAVIERPASFDIMRRIIEFGIDGYGTQLAFTPSHEERRKNTCSETNNIKSNGI